MASSSLPSFTSRLRALTCQLRPELDAVRRVDVDHLDLAAQALALGEASHHLQAVAEDHAVRPVGLVLVEVDDVELVEAVERVEQRQLGLGLAGLRRSCAGSRPAPAGRSSPGCRSAARRPRGRRRPGRPCPSTRAAGRATGRAGSAASPAASASGDTKSWASAVGMLVRLSWWMVASTGVGSASCFLRCGHQCSSVRLGQAGEQGRRRTGRRCRRRARSRRELMSSISMKPQRPKPPWLFTGGHHCSRAGLGLGWRGRLVLAAARHLDDQVRSMSSSSRDEPDEEVGHVLVAAPRVHVGDREAEVVVLHVRTPPRGGARAGAPPSPPTCCP